jgi:hypothetical protein
MAKPTTLGFASFKVYINTANSPDTYVAPCGFTQKALTLAADSSETLVPDCDDPTAPAWKEREVSALSAQVSGSGVMALESLDEWREWFESADVRPVRVMFDTTLANNGGYYEGNAILSSLGFSTALNQDGNKVQLQVTIDSAGEWLWHDAAA